MMILNVNKIAKSYGFGEILKDISFTVNEGEKVAIVGANGCGKSTMLKIIAGIEPYKSGDMSIKKGSVIKYLEQGDNADVQEGKCIEILRSCFENLFKLEQEIKVYEEKMSIEKDSNKLDELVKIYCSMQEKFSLLGGYEIENQINFIVNGLKIDKSLLNREFNTLSGGERTLINFAKILLSKPDLLLLDEPTNHLDIERIEWLEQFIKDYKGTIIIVSHDRYFLDKVVNKILEIEEGKSHIYFGNYSSYLEQKEAEEVKEFAIYKVQQKKFQEMEKAIKRLYEWGKKADNPTFFRRAKAIKSNLDRMRAEALEKPKEHRNLPISFDQSKRGAEDVLVVKDYCLKAGDKELLVNANTIVKNGEKVAILGKNGTGKTSFLKAMQGEDYTQSGVCRLAGNQQVGYLSQIIEFENPKTNLLTLFMEELSIDEPKARAILFTYQFYGDDVGKRVGSLSGGEKLRLKLALMLQNKVNLLIFDEPTNHIDITTREVLEESLQAFKGTIIFVSHDRYFVNKLATKIISFEDKRLVTYNGDYDYFVKQKNKG